MDDIQSFIVVLLRAMNQRRLLVLTFGLAVLCMFTLWQVHIQSPESSPKAPYVNVAHEAMPSSATSAVDYQDRFGSDSFQPPKGAPPDEAEVTPDAEDVQVLQRHINRVAAKSVINGDKFPPPKAGFVPIVLYVFQRPAYFKKVIEGLERVHDISETELVISHDGLLPEMDDIVDSIDFMRVRQIIHPVSMKHKGSLTNLKNHWLFFIEKAFKDLYPTAAHILFLEEDHLVSRDFYRTTLAITDTFDKLPDERKALHWGSALFAMGNGKEPSNVLKSSCGVINAGYVYPRSTFNLLMKLKPEIMSIHEGWDRIVYLLMEDKKMPNKVLWPELSRIVNIGKDGLNMRPEEGLSKESSFQYPAVLNWIDC